MDNTYSHEKKKKLAEKISRQKKEDMVKIMEIIYESNKNITENQNGVFLLFNKLDDATYHKLDLYLRSITKKKSSDGNVLTSDNNTKSDKSEQKEFTSYSKNDFPDQEKLNPKLKYSNRERNIIKRQRYDNHLTSESNNGSGIVYQKFDINTISDSDTTGSAVATSRPTSEKSNTSSVNTVKTITQTVSQNTVNETTSDASTFVKITEAIDKNVTKPGKKGKPPQEQNILKSKKRIVKTANKTK